MVEPAENRDLYEAITWRRPVFNRRRYRLADSLMRAGTIVVATVLGEDRQKLPLRYDEVMVETFSADTAQQPLAVSIRVRCSIRREENSDAGSGCDVVEVSSELVVPVANQILRRTVRRCCIPELLRGPCTRWKSRHSDMDDTSGADLDDEEREKRSEEDVIRLQEIASPYVTALVVDERLPGLVLATFRVRTGGTTKSRPHCRCLAK